MFCQYCGTHNADEAKFCASCGAKLNNEQVDAEVINPEITQPVEVKNLSGRAVAGFVLSLVGLIFAGMICGVLGIIFSAISMKEINTKGLKGKGLAIAGLVISIVDVVLMLIYYSV